MKIYIDRAQDPTPKFYFTNRAEWFAVEVDVPKDLVDTLDRIRDAESAITLFMAQVYESRRAGSQAPELPDNIKEIINTCLVPVKAERAKKQKQQDIEAASSTPSPAA